MQEWDTFLVLNDHTCIQTFVYERHFSKWKKRKKKSKPQIIFIVFKTSSFLQDVFSKVNHSGNQDIGEGMFDGLMQVMVCGVSENVDPYRYHIDVFCYWYGKMTIWQLLVLGWFLNIFPKYMLYLWLTCVYNSATVKDKIGWRNKARRMVVYATDVNFHQAGDGRVSSLQVPYAWTVSALFH